MDTRAPIHLGGRPSRGESESRRESRYFEGFGCGHGGLVGAGTRAELLHVLMLPDFQRADRIGEFWGHAESRNLAELLIECEEDRTLRAVLVGMLREHER